MTRVPTLETNRLILRDIRREDIPSYQANFASYDVVQFLSSQVPWPYPADGVETFIKTMIDPHQGIDQWFWVITLKSEPAEAIGCVHLWRDGRPEHRGFWLAKKHWGLGLMTEAVAPVLDHAFGPLGFETLVFSNALGNIGSRRIKEKTGARFLGIRTVSFVNPQLREAETWELSKKTWQDFHRA